MMMDLSRLVSSDDCGVQLNTEARALLGGRYSTPCWLEMTRFVTLPDPNVIYVCTTNGVPPQDRVNPGTLHGSGMSVVHIFLSDRTG